MITKRRLQAIHKTKVTLETEMEKLNERIGKLEKVFLTLGGSLNTKATSKMRFRKGEK